MSAMCVSPGVRQRQDLHTASELDRRMCDLAAAELYEQILLGCVRAGLDPNAKSEVEEYDGYVPPSFDPVQGARVAAEQRTRHAEIYRERESIIQALHASPQHRQLSAFDRLLTETEYWTGVREWTGSSGGGGGGGKTSRLRRRHKEAGENGGDSVGFDMLHLTETPSYIRGKLRPYQIEGVNWLLGLFSCCINGILADEMGLGKTLQTIATLAYLKFTHGLPGPHLVVCPKSVMGNWYRELKQWCPALSAFKFHGPSEIRPQLIKSHLQPYEKIKYDVIVTTFEMVLEELPTFKRIHWQYLIVDEAHKLKNEESRAHTALDSLVTNHRLIITGTPLQNNLKELWALLHFLVPRLFDDSESFDAWFDTASGHQDSNAMSNMHKILAPLMIRRLKSEVSTGIPPKKEIYVACKLTKTQRKWYMHVLAKDAEVLNKASGGSVSSLTNIMMNLRKVINHPYMMDGGEEGPPFITDERIVKHSGKMIILDKLLHRLLHDKAEKHKVLIFSQFTSMLDILEDYCGMRGFKVCRIDGNTSGYDRDAQMAAFNSPNSDYFLFLLSTRAGGLGINLQAANHVVIYDSDWNPQMDLQAQDRAHRIGQKREVRVYRFVTDGTVEEKIYRRALKKLYLDAMVVQHGRMQGRGGKNVSKEELLSMIKFGAEEIFKAKDEDVTEADIDRLFEGEEKSRQLTNAVKEQVQMSLASFQLGAEEANVYDFEGVSFKAGVESRIVHITLATPVAQDELHRQCSQHGEVTKVVLHPNLTEALVFFRSTSGAIEAKDNLPYKCQFAARDAQTVVPTEMITEYLTVGEKLGRGHRVREAIQKYTEEEVERMQSRAVKAPPLRLPKRPNFPPYQLYNAKRLQELHTTEVALMVQNWKRKYESSGNADNEQPQQDKDKEEQKKDPNEEEDETLTAVEQEERERLLNEGFANWSFQEYRRLIAALTSGAHDVTDYPALAAAVGTGKTVGEVRDYVTTLLERGAQCIKGFVRIEQRIKKSQDKRREREAELRAAKWKVESCDHPESELTFKVRGTPEFDRQLFLMAYDAGFGMQNTGEVIKGMPENRFDVWCQSRNDAYFERRLRNLLQSVKREWEKPSSEVAEPASRRRKLEAPPSD
ncbi:putative transcription activator [Trypanosoma grayi]|uniref:putative transcription activator n=1 Tax=Trypanosoma grayi TaxID=71804 RepID=UPI0004F3F2D3|nr:putative transcription activator [Trypanosoma grayi]KEG11953.1 putative transcription activator [Trypanosoma grayi]